MTTHAPCGTRSLLLIWMTAHIEKLYCMYPLFASWVCRAPSTLFKPGSSVFWGLQLRPCVCYFWSVHWWQCGSFDDKCMKLLFWSVYCCKFYCMKLLFCRVRWCKMCLHFNQSWYIGTRNVCWENLSTKVGTSKNVFRGNLWSFSMEKREKIEKRGQLFGFFEESTRAFRGWRFSVDRQTNRENETISYREYK